MATLLAFPSRFKRLRYTKIIFYYASRFFYDKIIHKARKTSRNPGRSIFGWRGKNGKIIFFPLLIKNSKFFFSTLRRCKLQMLRVARGMRNSFTYNARSHRSGSRGGTNSRRRKKKRVKENKKVFLSRKVRVYGPKFAVSVVYWRSFFEDCRPRSS